MWSRLHLFRLFAEWTSKYDSIAKLQKQLVEKYASGTCANPFLSHLATLENVSITRDQWHAGRGSGAMGLRLDVLYKFATACEVSFTSTRAFITSVSALKPAHSHTVSDAPSLPSCLSHMCSLSARAHPRIVQLNSLGQAQFTATSRRARALRTLPPSV